MAFSGAPSGAYVEHFAEFQRSICILDIVSWNWTEVLRLTTENTEASPLYKVPSMSWSTLLTIMSSVLRLTKRDNVKRSCEVNYLADLGCPE